MRGALPCAVLVARGGWLGYLGYRPRFGPYGLGDYRGAAWRGSLPCLRLYRDQRGQSARGASVAISPATSRGVVERYRPDTAAIESIYFGANVRSAIPHGAMPAVPRSWRFSECALEIGEYTPMQIKQAVVGTGAADKRQVAYMVRIAHAARSDPHPDHAADALACAICHVNLSRTRALTGGEFYQQRGTGY